LFSGLFSSWSKQHFSFPFIWRQVELYRRKQKWQAQSLRVIKCQKRWWWWYAVVSMFVPSKTHRDVIVIVIVLGALMTNATIAGVGSY
jgi:hypothetical protein